MYLLFCEHLGELVQYVCSSCAVLFRCTVTVWYQTRRRVVPYVICYICDDIILALSKSGHGCYFDNMFTGCIMYADDLLLLSTSLCDLRAMVDICYVELEKVDMKLNVKK